MGFTAFPRPPPRPKIAQNRAFSARETQNRLSATNRVLYNGHPHLSYGAQPCDPPMGPVYNGHPHLSYGAQPCDPPMGPCTTGITPDPPEKPVTKHPKTGPKRAAFYPLPSNPVQPPPDRLPGPSPGPSISSSPLLKTPPNRPLPRTGASPDHPPEPCPNAPIPAPRPRPDLPTAPNDSGKTRQNAHPTMTIPASRTHP